MQELKFNKYYDLLTIVHEKYFLMGRIWHWNTVGTHEVFPEKEPSVNIYTVIEARTIYKLFIDSGTTFLVLVIVAA